jgi:hypothetical protein
MEAHAMARKTIETAWRGRIVSLSKRRLKIATLGGAVQECNTL